MTVKKIKRRRIPASKRKVKVVFARRRLERVVTVARGKQNQLGPVTWKIC